MKKSLPTKPGANLVKIEDHLSDLFKMDTEIFSVPPILFPFDRAEGLLKYLTKDHKTTSFIWNNDQGELVGYYSIEEKTEIPNLVELINIGIKPKFQNQGYGKKLMEHLLAYLKDKQSRLVTHPGNKSARKLYERYGYLPVKIIDNYFGDGQPRLLYFRPAT